MSCKVQHHLTSCNMLPYIASGWPNICNTLHTTMLHLSYVFEIHLCVIHDIVIFLDKAVKAFSWVWEWQIKANGWKKEENITSQECWFQVSRSYIGWNYWKVPSECFTAVLQPVWIALKSQSLSGEKVNLFLLCLGQQYGMVLFYSFKCIFLLFFILVAPQCTLMI